jgi:hypothetical protein
MSLTFNCSRPQEAPECSFYYWRTKYHLGETEREFLDALRVEKLFVRFFDVGIDSKSGLPAPITPLIVPCKDSCFTITPVVFIKNSVFENTSNWIDDSLALKTVTLVNSISSRFLNKSGELQIDCDWTEKTKNRYFQFLTKLSLYTADTISVTSTVRLHQIKYSAVTGIPPVKQVSVMLYNMNSPAMDTTCSIYDHGTALRYIPWLKKYPLKMDLALPIFSWGIQSRKQDIVSLLSKYSLRDAMSDPGLTPIGKSLFQVNKSHFYQGYFFKKDDVIKVEETDHRHCTDVMRACKKIRSLRKSTIIFYDLDSLNFQRTSIDALSNLRNQLL